MRKIETNSWKAFKIIDLFEVKNTHSILKNQIEEDSGTTPYVTASNENNGVYTYIEYNEDLIEPGNCIMIGGKTLTITYQSRNFYSNDSHNLALYLKNTQHQTENVYLFLITALKASIGHTYNWGDSISSKSIRKDDIILPVDKTGNPDFSYMEEYMKNREIAVSFSLTALQSAKQSGFSQNINTNGWNTFKISELFDVKKGTRLTKANMKEGPIRFIGASSVNNGITAHISNNEHLHPKNTITLSYNGSVGEAFYQDEIFWASDDVNILYPKFEINKEIAFFIIPILKAAGKKYAFIDKWKKEDMENSTILLPADQKGNPDFLYIESYISNTYNEIELSLCNLTACAKP